MWENRHEEIFFELWSREFRLNPNTFEFVVNLVAGNMTRQDTHFRNAIKINKRVAVAIWRLSTGNSYRTVGIWIREINSREDRKYILFGAIPYRSAIH